MASKNPLHDAKSVPSKEELQVFLGPARYRRFEVVYDELVDLDLTPKLQWSDAGRSWFHAFYYRKKPIFNIEWGIDYFYASISLNPALLSQLVRDDTIASDTKALLQHGIAQQSKGLIQVEANLEHSKEQEAFFDLLPILLKRVN